MIDMLDALGIRKGKEVVGKYYQQLRNPQDTVSGKMWTIIQENSNSELGNILETNIKVWPLNALIN